MLFESVVIVLLAIIADYFLAEPRKFHPLVGFGYLANKIERRLNTSTAVSARWRGVLALLIMVVPLPALLIVFEPDREYMIWLDLLILYLAIGRRSLMQHASAVMQPLYENKLEQAKHKLALMVSRDTAPMQQAHVIRASIESVIENSNDAVFGAITWYLLLGAPGVLLYRLVNTLDAMWGYKNERFIYFGWAAARLDDVMNWLPARLTVLGFALTGKFAATLRNSFQQGRQCQSINAGPVMAAGASALGVTLGGDAYYQGQKISKPILGMGDEPVTEDIARAMWLVNKSLMLWCLLMITTAIMIEVCCA